MPKRKYSAQWAMDAEKLKELGHVPLTNKDEELLADLIVRKVRDGWLNKQEEGGFSPSIGSYIVLANLQVGNEFIKEVKKIVLPK